MEFNNIEHKKPIYKIKAPLREHLRQYSRLIKLPISYDDLLRFQDLIPLTDHNGDETLWFGALYNESENEFFNNELINSLLITSSASMLSIHWYLAIVAAKCFWVL